MASKAKKVLVGVVMGSTSDWAGNEQGGTPPCISPNPVALGD